MVARNEQKDFLQPEPAAIKLAAFGGRLYRGGWGQEADKTVNLTEGLPIVTAQDIASIAEITDGTIEGKILAVYDPKGGPVIPFRDSTVSHINYSQFNTHLDFASHNPDPSSIERVPETHFNVNGVNISLEETVVVIKKSSDSVIFVGIPEKMKGKEVVTTLKISKEGFSYERFFLSSVLDADVKKAAEFAKEAAETTRTRLEEGKRTYPKMKSPKEKFKERDEGSVKEPLW